MNKLIRIGIDTSKSVFQLHGVDAAEQPVLRKKVRRKDLVGFLLTGSELKRLLENAALPSPRSIDTGHRRSA